MVLMLMMSVLTFMTVIMILIMILMMIPTMILMMVGAGTCVLSKFPGESVRKIGLRVWHFNGELLFTVQNSLWEQKKITNNNIGPFSGGS